MAPDARAAVTGTSRSTVGSRPKTSSSFLPFDTSLRRDTPASKALRSQHRIGGLLQSGTLSLLRKHPTSVSHCGVRLMTAARRRQPPEITLSAGPGCTLSTTGPTPDVRCVSLGARSWSFPAPVRCAVCPRQRKLYKQGEYDSIQQEPGNRRKNDPARPVAARCRLGAWRVALRLRPLRHRLPNAVRFLIFN